MLRRGGNLSTYVERSTVSRLCLKDRLATAQRLALFEPLTPAGPSLFNPILAVRQKRSKELSTSCQASQGWTGARAMKAW
jgi:hypothetical protein